MTTYNYNINKYPSRLLVLMSTLLTFAYYRLPVFYKQTDQSDTTFHNADSLLISQTLDIHNNNIYIKYFNSSLYLSEIIYIDEYAKYFSSANCLSNCNIYL